MQGVLLAAGKGKRLQPLTFERSKAMIPVAGRPLGARVADLLVAQGIDELIIVVSSQDAEVQPYFASQAVLGIPVRFVVQTERKGMAHALGIAAPFLHDTFIMSACDNLVAIEHVGEMVSAHHRLSAAATLSLMPIEISQASKTGVVEWDAPYVRRIVEKPRPEDAPSNISSLPLYIFSSAILDVLPMVTESARGELELQDAIQLLIGQNAPVVGVLTDSRQQVTDAADLLALNLQFLNQEKTLCLCNSPLPTDAHLIPPVVVEAGVDIGEECVIGPAVYVENGSRIGHSSRIESTLVMRGAEVRPGEVHVGEIIAPTLVAK
jgi:NDP-sugar pyrophosphorylase family protein